MSKNIKEAYLTLLEYEFENSNHILPSKEELNELWSKVVLGYVEPSTLINYFVFRGCIDYLQERRFQELAEKHLPKSWSSEEKENFVDEMQHRLANLDLDTVDTNGISVEEYYFNACYSYVQDHGLQHFLDEEDDLKIFDYCGCAPTLERYEDR